MPNFFEPMRKIRRGILRRPLRTLLALFISILAFLAGRAFLRFNDTPALPRFEQSLALRQLEALRDYASRQENGALLSPHDAVISMREQFLQEIIDRSLPLQQTFENGRYLVRLDAAKVKLEDGLAVVDLSGRGMLADAENSALYVDLLLQSIFSIPEVDPASGILRASLVITNVRIHRVGPWHRLGPLHPVFRYFSHLQVEEWNRLGEQIHLPIKVDQEITFPATEGEVRLPECRIPISVRVSAITTFQRRMAVSLALLPDSTFGESPAGNGQLGHRQEEISSLPLPKDKKGTDFKTNDATTALESLHQRLSSLSRQDPVWQGVTASDHDIIAIVPVSIMKTLATRVSRQYLAGVTVDFHQELAAKINAQLHTRILGRKIGVGRILGTIQFSQLRGKFTIAGNPRVRLDPPRDLVITVPARVLHGRGMASLDVKWDPALLAGAICNGFEAKATLAGTILPFREELTTRVEFSVQDSNIVGRSRVQRDHIKLKTDLSESSWSKVGKILAEQDEFGRCGMVMNADSALAKLKNFAHTGVKIRLPAKMFKAFKLPVTLHTDYQAGNYLIEAKAYAPEIEMTPQYLRLAFQTTLRVRPLSSSAKNKHAGAASVR